MGEGEYVTNAGINYLYYNTLQYTRINNIYLKSIPVKFYLLSHGNGILFRKNIYIFFLEINSVPVSSINLKYFSAKHRKQLCSILCQLWKIHSRFTTIFLFHYKTQVHWYRIRKKKYFVKNRMSGKGNFFSVLFT